MAGLQGAVETAAPVSRLHEHHSSDLADFPVPTGREEEWRFTPLRRLRGLHGDAAAGAGQGAGPRSDAAPGSPLRWPHAATPGSGPPSCRPTGSAPGRSRRSTRRTVITVPAETDVDEPTVVVGARRRRRRARRSGTPSSRSDGTRRAVVVLDHAGRATYADNVEFVVGDGASLTVVSVQDWAPDAVHLSHHQARVGRDATFQHTVVTLGGDVVRLAPAVSYAGPGGDAELLGLYFADAGQHLEHRLLVDHNQPHCRSRVDYRGALQGDSAHAVWIGDVLIRPEAIGTDTYERNRNLLLTDGARADSVPNLEILTGEVVGAGHASTSGRLEDEHLFYLMARGIPLDEARRLVIRGFFGELIAKIEVPELRERITAAIEDELAKLPGLQGAPA